MEFPYINDISWHNIYVTFSLKGDALDQYSYTLTNLDDQEYPLFYSDHKIIVNMVNIKNTKLLDNGKWYIAYQCDNDLHLCSVSVQCGYNLEQKDKLFRYGKECYAYGINFQIATKETIDNKKHKVKKFQTLKIAEDELICCMFTTYLTLHKKQDRRNILVESTSLKQFIRKSVFIVAKKGIQLIYILLSKIRKKDGYHILFMSETRVPISGNLKAIDERLKQRQLDKIYHISYSFSKTLQQGKLKTLFTWSQLLWLIAKQDFIFVDDYVPIFKTITLRSSTKLIQAWHAGVGFKSVGYSRFGKAGSPLPKDSCHRKYDYALVGGAGLIPVYEEVFGIDKSKFIATGLPRLDHYLEPTEVIGYQTKFYQDYPQCKGKKVIMFAPTYRGNTQKSAYYPFDKIDLQEVYKRLCRRGYIFIFKMHPFILEKVQIPHEMKQEILDLSNYGDINEMFYVTDILITDFSSNMYEFALQKKPIIFYAFDKDLYQLTRGVHQTLDEAPGNVCTDFDQVIETIIQESYDLEKLSLFIQNNFDHQDQLSSDLIIDTILQGKKRL